MKIVVQAPEQSPRVQQQLASCPTAGAGVHNWLFTTGLVCARFGVEPSVAVDLIRKASANCGRVIPESELVGQVRAAYWEVGKSSAGEYKPSKVKSGESGDSGRRVDAQGNYRRLSPKELPRFDREALSFAAQAGPAFNSLAQAGVWFQQRSPMPHNSTPLEFVNALYRPGEVIHVFRHMDATAPALSVTIGDPKITEIPPQITDSIIGKGTWFLSNPTDGKWHEKGDGGTSCRSKEAITDFRYAVLEIDPHQDLPPDEKTAILLDWASYIASLEAPIAAIYTSGGRSIHALVRVDAGPNKYDWDRLVDVWKGEVLRHGADPHAMTAVRLSRLPGCRRREANDPNDPLKGHQILLYLNPNPSPEHAIMDLPTTDESSPCTLKNHPPN